MSKKKVVREASKKSVKRPATAADRISTLQNRCKANGIELEEREDEEGDTSYRLALPAGRKKRHLTLWSDDQVRDLLSVDFENLSFVGDYVAICSYAESYVEAAIQTSRYSSSYVLPRLLDQPHDQAQNLSLTITATDVGRDANIVVSYASKELQALSRRVGGSKTLSLRINGLQIATHDHALKVLNSVANAFFFQVDVTYNMALQLRRDVVREVQRGAHLRSKPDVELRFPTTEFDSAPITLYSYARSAANMPLLQYLAFYQSIEFYFPTYHRAESTRRVRNVLKDPTFRPDRDADIGRVLSSLSVTRSGRPDERSMLRATIRECLDASELRAFIEESEERRSFLSAKSDSLTTEKVPVAQPNADLRDSVADRIYDIRCKIVHTKLGTEEDNGTDILLPFSKQERQLGYDLGLIRYVAQQVLIAGSAPIDL